jgi:hypothetical protein
MKITKLFKGAAASLMLACGAVGAQTPQKLIEFNYGIPNADHAAVFVARTWVCSRRPASSPSSSHSPRAPPCLRGSRARVWMS